MRNNIRFKTSLMVGLLSLHALSSCSSARQQLGMSDSDSESCLSSSDDNSDDTSDRCSLSVSTSASQQSTIHNHHDNPAYEPDVDKIDSLSSQEARSDDDETADDIYRKYGVKPSKGSWLGRWNNLSFLKQCGIIGTGCVVVGGLSAAVLVGGTVLACAVSKELLKSKICKPLGFEPSNPRTTTDNPLLWSNISVITEQLLSSDPDNPFSLPKRSTTVEPDLCMKEIDREALWGLSNGKFDRQTLKNLVEKEKLCVNATVKFIRSDHSRYELWIPLLFECLTTRFSSVDSFNYLKDQGVNVNMQSSTGLTALMYVVIDEEKDVHEDRFIWLLENGANPFIKDKYGATVRGYIESYKKNHTLRHALLRKLNWYEDLWEVKHGKQ